MAQEPAKERKSFTLEPGCAEALDGVDNASAVVNKLVGQWREGSRGRDTVALELRRQQKKRELDEARDRVGRLQGELDEIESLVEELEAGQADEIEQVAEALADTPLEPDNPAVQRQASKVEVEPAALVARLEEEYYE